MLYISSVSSSDSLQPNISDCISGRSPSLMSPATRDWRRCSAISALVNDGRLASSSCTWQSRLWPRERKFSEETTRGGRRQTAEKFSCGGLSLLNSKGTLTSTGCPWRIERTELIS